LSASEIKASVPLFPVCQRIKTLYWIFLHKKTAKTIQTLLIQKEKTFQKYSSCDTIPLMANRRYDKQYGMKTRVRRIGRRRGLREGGGF
jgi:hypothetical protein